MRILKGILNESREYYLNLEREILARLAKLPKGSVKKRKLHGRYYYYLQNRAGKKVVHQYLGRSEPDDLIEKIKKRKMLQRELREVKSTLRLLNKTTSKKHV